MRIEKGVLRNPCFRDYKLITAPRCRRCDLHFIETHCAEGPYGAKGISELPTIVIAPAIANALYNATGVRIFNPPMSPETVARAIHERSNEMRKVIRRHRWGLESRMNLRYCAWLRDGMGCASEHIGSAERGRERGHVARLASDPGTNTPGARLNTSMSCWSRSISATQIETIPCMTRTKSFWLPRSRAAERRAYALPRHPNPNIKHAIDLPILSERQHEAPHRAVDGAGAVAAVRDAALCPARLAGHPDRGDDSGEGLPGDPNRYIGTASPTTIGAAISSPPTSARKRSRSTSRIRAGKRSLRRLIRALDVDVFCCNTVPSRYASLGIDYDDAARRQAGSDLGGHLGDGARLSRRRPATIR